MNLKQYLPVRKREGRYFEPAGLRGPVAYHAHDASGIVLASGYKGACAMLLRATVKRQKWQRVLELPPGQSLSDPVFHGRYAYFCGIARRGRRTIGVYRVNLRTGDVRDMRTPAEAKGTLRIINVRSPGVIIMSETHIKARMWKADLIATRLTALGRASAADPSQS